MIAPNYLAFWIRLMLARRDFLFLLFGTASMAAGAARADDGGGDGGDGHDGGDDHGGDDKGGDDKGGDDDGGNPSGLSHDDARQERLKGEVMPLSKALMLVERKIDGDVIDIRLSKGARGYYYRFKIRDGAGVIRTLRLDARSGRILSFLGS
jgi:hypothetical protein